MLVDIAYDNYSYLGYWGNGRTIVTTVDDEFVTILVTGESFDKAIQMIEQ